MDASLKVFLIGVAGGVAMEIYKAVRHLESGRKPPARYRNWVYWLLRLVLALVGGLLNVLYDVQNLLLAFQIGLSTDAILESLAKPPSEIVPSEVAAKPDQPPSGRPQGKPKDKPLKPKR